MPIRLDPNFWLSQGQRGGDSLSFNASTLPVHWQRAAIGPTVVSLKSRCDPANTKPLCHLITKPLCHLITKRLCRLIIKPLGIP